MTQCSDGIDNDGDGKIDYIDPECVGPLDNDEGSFATGIPGDNIDACKQDCFFDGNSGMGDDGCDWQLKCDPMTNNASCPYDAAYAQSHMTECSVSASQSGKCIDSCRKLVPNGCDCFGCCAIPGATTPIRLAPRAPRPTSATPPSARRARRSPSARSRANAARSASASRRSLPTAHPYDGGVPDAGTPYNCPAGYMACGQYGIDPALCPEGTGCVTGCCRPLVP